MALFALALAALAGGLAHALVGTVPAWLEHALWRAVFFGMGLVSYSMVVGTAYAVTRKPLRTVLFGVAVAGFVFYALRSRAHHDFGFVILGYAAGLALVGGLAAVALLRGHQPVSMRWWLVGIAITVLASMVQRSGFSLHRHFNHNDLYHLIGALAVVAFFLGAREVEDADAASTVAIGYESARASSNESIGETDSANPPGLDVDRHNSA